MNDKKRFRVRSRIAIAIDHDVEADSIGTARRLADELAFGLFTNLNPAKVGAELGMLVVSETHRSDGLALHQLGAPWVVVRRGSHGLENMLVFRRIDGEPWGLARRELEGRVGALAEQLRLVTRAKWTMGERLVFAFHSDVPDLTDEQVGCLTAPPLLDTDDAMVPRSRNQ